MPIANNLKPKTVSEDDIRIMPNMVRWFDPDVLFKILKPVLISGIFGDYADRRLMQAALDKQSREEQYKSSDIRDRLKKDDNGKLWVDFIADTGDGFASTYTVAWLQSQPELSLGGVRTQRGELLLLGGDQVYPDATYFNYMNRFKKVFEWAYPDSGEADDAKHPPVFAIPGNHDWYDGLKYFLAFFCSVKPWKLGNWRAIQRRSYFATQVTDSVWVWGTDIQLSEDVDSPQAEYFREIAKRMPVGSTIVLMTAVPGWYAPTERGFNCLGYVEKIAHKAERGLRVPLVLSGDVHHYARYECKEVGTQFITCGGGGAFLHATNTLPKETKGSWGDKKGKVRKISLAEIIEGDSKREACYPSRVESHALLRGLYKSPLQNWKFGGILGVLYALAGLTSLMWSEIDSLRSALSNPVWLGWCALMVLIFTGYADRGDWSYSGRSLIASRNDGDSRVAKWLRARKHWILGGAHGIAHVTAITLISQFAFELLSTDFKIQFWSWGFNSLFLPAVVILGGLAAGIIFAIYLYICCRFLGVHANDALSAQSLDKFRGFLRLAISDDKIIVYPVGVDDVLQKRQWKPNTDVVGSKVVPTVDISSRLIEPAISVPISRVQLNDAAGQPVV
jgi:hypothetical protein